MKMIVEIIKTPIFKILFLGKTFVEGVDHYIMEINTANANWVDYDRSILFKKLSADTVKDTRNEAFHWPMMEQLYARYADKCFGVIAYENGVPVGFVWAVTEGVQERQYYVKQLDGFFVLWCYVDPTYRGKRIANMLLHKLVQQNPNKQSITLPVRKNNKSAIHSYEFTGFKVVEERRFKLVLRKPIPRNESIIR